MDEWKWMCLSIVLILTIAIIRPFKKVHFNVPCLHINFSYECKTCFLVKNNYYVEYLYVLVGKQLGNSATQSFLPQVNILSQQLKSQMDAGK